MERGTVLAHDAATQRFIVAVDGDSCAVFELQNNEEMAVGHKVRGNLESDACFTLENLTTGEVVGVVPLGNHESLEQAERLLRG